MGPCLKFSQTLMIFDTTSHNYYDEKSDLQDMTTHKNLNKNSLILFCSVNNQNPGMHNLFCCHISLAQTAFPFINSVVTKQATNQHSTQPMDSVCYIIGNNECLKFTGPELAR